MVAVVAVAHCTGCTESTLVQSDRWADRLILRLARALADGTLVPSAASDELPRAPQRYYAVMYRSNGQKTPIVTVTTIMAILLVMAGRAWKAAA